MSAQAPPRVEAHRVAPARMRAIVCRRNGTPEAVQIEEVEKPAPTEGQVGSSDGIRRTTAPKGFIHKGGAKRRAGSGHEAQKASDGRLLHQVRFPRGAFLSRTHRLRVSILADLNPVGWEVKGLEPRNLDESLATDA